MTFWLVILIVYLAVSLATLAVYAYDKQNAASRRWRTRESTLHLLEALGGWPGALIGQRVLRHKNRKVRYQVVFWLIVAAHVAGLVALAWLRHWR